MCVCVCASVHARAHTHTLRGGAGGIVPEALAYCVPPLPGKEIKSVFPSSP